jgi:hypothetical protein
MLPPVPVITQTFPDSRPDICGALNSVPATMPLQAWRTCVPFESLDALVMPDRGGTGRCSGVEAEMELLFVAAAVSRIAGIRRGHVTGKAAMVSTGVVPGAKVEKGT